MLERAAWRRGLADPRTPLGTYLGRDAWLGLPVGLWVVLYGLGIGAAQRFLGGDWGTALLALTSGVVGGTPRKNYLAPLGAPRLGLRKTLALATSNPFALFTVSRMDAIADLVPLPTPDACFGVEITLRRGERITGGDLGVVVFSQGWLVYEGRSTAFSLSPGDVRNAWPGSTAWTFALPEGQSLTLLSYDEGWKAAIEAWSTLPDPPGLSRLPPLVPNVVRRLRTPAYFHMGAGIVAGLALAALGGKAGFAGFAAIGAFALLLLALGSFIAWRRR